MENKIKYSFTVSSQERNDLQRVVERIAELFSFKAGGCNIVLGTGYWAESAVNTKDEYPDYQSEYSAVITITDLEGMEQDFMNLVRLAAKNYPNVIEWVHFEMTEVKTNHFKV